MKKLIIAALLTITVATSVFASDEKKLNVNVLRSFETQFEDAEKVKWSSNSKYIKASFEVNGKKTDAFYNLDGEYIGCTKKITLEDLPVNAKRTFAKKYSDYTVKEAIKFDGTEETAYFVSAENDKQSLILKITGAGVSVFKKTSK
ncbi:MAG TPA: hypothetical protein VF622_10720 [Segetibacter sp.]|jgi:hypothetical protein